MAYSRVSKKRTRDRPKRRQRSRRSRDGDAPFDHGVSGGGKNSIRPHLSVRLSVPDWLFFVFAVTPSILCREGIAMAKAVVRHGRTFGRGPVQTSLPTRTPGASESEVANRTCLVVTALGLAYNLL